MPTGIRVKVVFIEWMLLYRRQYISFFRMQWIPNDNRMNAEPLQVHFSWQGVVEESEFPQKVFYDPHLSSPLSREAHVGSYVRAQTFFLNIFI